MKKKMQLFVMMLFVMLLAGCGAKSAATEESYDMAAPMAEAPAEEAIEEEVWMEETTAETGDAAVTSTSGVESVKNTSQKLIKTVGMSVQTKEFDDLMTNIKTTVEDMGGYIESSEISGNSYYSQNHNRNAWLTLRIPAEKLDGFVTIVEELGNVTSKRESVEDITLRYVDVQSHKEALTIQQERLMELLEQAESMEDIIAIESRLSEVRYELQSYESTLRTYDNKVNYSTVNMDVFEVEREIKIAEERNFFEEIAFRLGNNFYDIGRNIREFAIWFISSLPYLVIWAIVIFVVIRVIMKIFWKRPFLKRLKKHKIEKDTDIE